MLPFSKKRSLYHANHSFVVMALLLMPVFGSTAAHASDPSSPQNLRYAVYSSGAAEVFWDRATDDGIVLSYEIEFNDEIVGNFDALSYFTNTLEKGQIYDVAVTSIDDDGDRSLPAKLSFVSGETASPSVPDTGATTGSGAIAAPVGLSANVYSSTSGEIFWDRSDTFGLIYEIQRNGDVLRTTDGVSFYDADLMRATDYEYAVLAIDEQGNRSQASTVTFSTGGTPPVEPPVENRQ